MTKSNPGTVRRMTANFFSLLLLLFLSPVLMAQSAGTSPAGGRIWGYSFGDLIYKAQGDTLYWGNTEYASLEEKTIGSNLRRLFLGYDAPLAENLKARFLVEGRAGTTTREGRFGLAIVTGYFEWNKVVKFIPNSSLKVGLIPTPIFALPEKKWGYRSVEKDALDLRGWGKTIDQGASFSGDFNRKQSAGFSVMVGNGSGNRPEIDKYLEYSASLYKKLWQNQFTIEILGEYMRKSPEARQAFVRCFLSVEKPTWTFGAEVSQALTQEVVSATVQPVNPLSVSLFFSNKLGFLGENWRSFFRYDFYNPATQYHPEGTYASPAQHYNEHSYWVGLHYILKEKVNLMPNLIINQYQRKNDRVVKRISDVVPRVTVYFLFGD
ncbi:MAG: hypothetical protein H6577_00650 [Lewinellaceae bacterium]|nr:hypothetical protein [Saprospiraceae bacterium]MCB9336616.1 hypothetical protein [Lewinellaceae bacterium]